MTTNQLLKSDKLVSNWRYRLQHWIKTQNNSAGYEIKLENFIEQELSTLLDWVEEMIGGEDSVDDLKSPEKEYSAQDMELIAVHMRNKLRSELRAKLKQIRKQIE